MINILVTGSKGFIGSNLVAVLARDDELNVFEYDIDNTNTELQEALLKVDIIYHLAGVNRPREDSEFVEVNAGLTREICDFLIENERSPKIVLSSSIQADKDNPYGASKKAAEEVLKNYHKNSGAEVAIYRLPNAFGKWSKPNYNTVVATFCDKIARNLPIQISNPSNELQLVYIDDIVRAFRSELKNGVDKGFKFVEVNPVHSITLGELAEMIQSFRSSRETLIAPEMGDELIRCMYATYLSFLPQDEFSYQLPINTDDRGSLAEFIKSPHMGQMFVSRTKPGVTRGNHYHHTKVEKFLVLEGKGVIRFRNINGDDVLRYEVDGEDYRVVDIPPGYTHSIENVGSGTMVVLFWAGEIYDKENPDTVFLAVKS